MHHGHATGAADPADIDILARSVALDTETHGFEGDGLADDSPRGVDLGGGTEWQLLFIDAPAQGIGFQF
jgi:hypothetical protein